MKKGGVPRDWFDGCRRSGLVVPEVLAPLHALLLVKSSLDPNPCYHFVSPVVDDIISLYGSLPMLRARARGVCGIHQLGAIRFDVV